MAEPPAQASGEEWALSAQMPDKIQGAQLRETLRAIGFSVCPKYCTEQTYIKKIIVSLEF